MAWLPRKKVVVPIDFSGDSVDSVSAAIQLAGDKANVQALHVIVPLGSLSPEMDWGAVDDMQRQEKAAEHFGEFLSEHGFDGIATDVRVGDPGLEIADYAKENRADLIVIPSHGYHGVKRALLGSVAERVIRHADCPVLVLRRSDAD